MCACAHTPACSRSSAVSISRSSCKARASTRVGAAALAPPRLLRVSPGGLCSGGSSAFHFRTWGAVGFSTTTPNSVCISRGTSSSRGASSSSARGPVAGLLTSRSSALGCEKKKNLIIRFVLRCVSTHISCSRADDTSALTYLFYYRNPSCSRDPPHPRSPVPFPPAHGVLASMSSETRFAEPSGERRCARGLMNRALAGRVGGERLPPARCGARG